MDLTLTLASAEFKVSLRDASCWMDCALFSAQLEAFKQTEIREITRHWLQKLSALGS